MEPELALHLLVHFLVLLLQACHQRLEAAWHHLVHVSPLPLCLAALGAMEEPQRRPSTGVPRHVWRLDTSSDWWDRIVLERWEDRQWTQNFRMRRDTFLELCEWLAPALRRRDTRMRPAIPLQKRVAIALWKLSTPDSYRSVGNQFGVGRSTVGAVLMQVVKAINRVLLHRVVRLANPDAVIRGFGALGFPNCGGAIDGTHIPICAPEHQASRYVNRKGYFSVILQAVCDHRGQFTDSSRTLMWAGPAKHTTLGCTATPPCTSGCRPGPSSPTATSGSGTWTCPCAWWGMPPTHCSPGS
ncbi:uncharacterized protein LOC142829216 [Pelodiscus sinensis]|uniref:uncharacterized protein LOC142829216 n=1 Tax=Pelodiscus sinensis TaxID=13735 RepID=UPI003F6B92A7